MSFMASASAGTCSSAAQVEPPVDAAELGPGLPAWCGAPGSAARGESGRSESQQSTASTRAGRGGPRPGWTIMSPRDTSISSSSCSITDCSATASRSEASAEPDGLDPAGATRGQHLHLVAHRHSPGLDAARRSRGSRGARCVLRPADLLHREAEELGSLGVGGRGRPPGSRAGSGLVPAEPVAALDHHVAGERREGDEAHVVDAEPRGEGQVVGLDAVEDLLGLAHQVHLVHGDDQVRDAEQVGDVGVAAGLGQHALARVDQDDAPGGRSRRRSPCCGCTARGPGRRR